MPSRPKTLDQYWPKIQPSVSRRGSSLTGSAILVMEQVLHTPELLEWIFLQMDQADVLLHVQLVCKYFRDVVQRSPKVQTMLDFRPSMLAKADHGELLATK